jgi:hypothetical protein
VNDPDALQDGDVLRITYTSVVTPALCGNLGLISLHISDFAVVGVSDQPT